MAIGGEFNNGTGSNNNSGNNNGGTNKMYENTYFSRVRIKQADGKKAVGFSFRSGLLILSADVLQDQNGFKWDTVTAIHLSPTKAKLFAKEIEKFQKAYTDGTIIPGQGYGVNAGMGEKISYIALYTDEDRNIFIQIGKFDGNGQVVESADTQLNKDYHFALEWNNVSAMDLSKVYYDMVELEQLKELAEDFGRQMNGVIGYAVADAARFDLGRILRKMDPLYDKLGIERRSSGNGNNYNRSNNFLNNSQSRHTSFDEIEYGFGGDDE